MKHPSRSAAEWNAAIARSDSTALSRTTVSSTVAKLSSGGYKERKRYHFAITKNMNVKHAKTT